MRLDFIEKRSTEAKNDVLVYLLVDVFDRYKAETIKRNQTELMSSFIQMVSYLSDWAKCPSMTTFKRFYPLWSCFTRWSLSTSFGKLQLKKNFYRSLFRFFYWTKWLLTVDFIQTWRIFLDIVQCPIAILIHSCVLAQQNFS